MTIIHPQDRPSPGPIQAEIDALLLSGRATTMAEAERLVLDAHLRDVAALAERTAAKSGWNSGCTITCCRSSPRPGRAGSGAPMGAASWVSSRWRT